LAQHPIGRIGCIGHIGHFDRKTRRAAAGENKEGLS
jgi:hypothetical protein